MVTKKLLDTLAGQVLRHGNIRIGKANINPKTGVGFYCGPARVAHFETKDQMYGYLVARLRAMENNLQVYKCNSVTGERDPLGQPYKSEMAAHHFIETLNELNKNPDIYFEFSKVS
jgi:hypothetical protein